ncbi:hypothetical protein N3C_0063 [Clostridium sp. N3C]|jgi:coenzyme F420-reducing hydrogenase delta subunit|uniref:hypothetical protein n=1 Tax=Clostridium sp. N3C TaxID=1776758 RepID=UPI00092DEF71|nr:hypothetical protein [Clostridium sp. N3C]SCN21287.1 hypothetical protein N3C_0063 [Clostridium sp. N3C]
MEFRINKVDTDLRQKINDTTREGKVHTKEGVLIYKHKYDERKHQKNNKRTPKEKFEIKKYIKNKKITIEAVKVEKISIKAEKEEALKNANEYRGVFIDSRR